MTELFNNWLALGIFSCVLLGFYDVLKKIALTRHDIVTVLFYSSIFSGLLLLPLVILSTFSIVSQNSFLYISPLEPLHHVLIFLKSLTLTTVWVLAFKSMQNLPISIVTPLWATDSIWTFLGAIFIFNEKVNLYQWLALFVIVFSFIYFSKIGKKEGICFHKNIYIIFLMIAIILGTFASLYDKYLMSFLHPLTVLAWFSFYNILIFLFYKLANIKFNYTIKKRGIDNKKISGWNIKILTIVALIGIIVSLQDLAFFYALTLNDSMVSVLTAIKRSSAVVSFLVGAVIFKEQLLRQKFYSLVGIILGVFLLLTSSEV